MQRRMGSFIEAWGNVVVGFGINYVMNLVVLKHLFGMPLTYLDNFYIGLIFTVISVARSYIIRRFFNGLKFNWNVENKEVESVQKRT